MNLKLAILSLTLLITFGQSSVAQTKYSKVTFDKQIKDTFSFAKNWDYSWEVLKDDSTGEFTMIDEHILIDISSFSCSPI